MFEGDSFGDNQSDYEVTGLSLDAIEREITAGLPAHADRLVSAFEAEEFLGMRNAQYITRRPSEEPIDFIQRPKRPVYLTRKVVAKLGEHLYCPGPTRTLKGADGAVAKWLDDVYQKTHVDAVMAVADEKALLNSACAVQVVCTGRAEKPVNLYVWGAHEFVPFFYPDDPTTPWAVVTVHRERDFLDGKERRRLKLEAWSRDEYRVYTTRWMAWSETMSFRNLFNQTASWDAELNNQREQAGVNPYGCLPFAFVHDRLPVVTFWEGGIGQPLVQANRELDRSTSDRAQLAKVHTFPPGFTRHVSAAFRRENRPGGFQPLTPDLQAAESQGTIEPDAFYVQPELNIDELIADDVHYANSVLEDLDVPLRAVRDSLDADPSGISLVIRILPLLQRAKKRQRPFGSYERELCGTILCAAGNFYGEPRLLAAAVAPELELVWPEPQFPLPTQERDQQDEWEMAHGIKSLVDVTAERIGATREQALDRLKQVEKDNRALAKLFEVVPAGTAPAAAPGPADAKDEPPDPAAEEDEEEE